MYDPSLTQRLAQPPTHNLCTAAPCPLCPPACLFCSPLCLSFHAMDSLCLVNAAPPFPCPCRCVLNACSSYRCHSGVRPGLHRGLPGVAQLAAQLHQEHELRQPRLPQNHRRGRGGRDPHRADGCHGTPCAPPPVPSGRQHGSRGGGRGHLPAVHCPASRGQHARSRDSLVRRAAHALHCKVTCKQEATPGKDGRSRHTHTQWGLRWLGLSLLKEWTTYHQVLHAVIPSHILCQFPFENHQ